MSTDRVGDGIGYGSTGRHDRWFADAFRAKGAKCGWYFNKNGSYMRHILAERQRIIHQRRGESLAIFVINQSLKERPADTLGDTPVNLSLNLSWIDGKSDILYGHVVKHTYLARLRINRYFCYRLCRHCRAWYRYCRVPRSPPRMTSPALPQR